MSVVYLEVDGIEVDEAIKILGDRGIQARNAVSVADDDSRDCKIVTYRRLYSMTLLMSVGSPDAMVEHEVRRVGDAWRDELRKLVADAVVR